MRELLGLDGRVDETEFLVYALTTPYTDPRQYLETISGRFGGVPVTNEVLQKFTELVDMERVNLTWFTEVANKLKELRASGKRIGLVSNSWPFPVRKFLTDTGLDDVFEHVIISSEVRVAKQQGSRIYDLAAELFAVPKDKICMIGDNPSLDIIPAQDAGLHTVLIDRYVEYVDREGNWKKPEFAGLDVPVIRCLDELPTP
jgi:HAD superfamily hydrolase (TIGR01549 family)